MEIKGAAPPGTQMTLGIRDPVGKVTDQTKPEEARNDDMTPQGTQMILTLRDPFDQVTNQKMPGEVRSAALQKKKLDLTHTNLLVT